MLIGIDASRAISDRPTGTETYSQRLIELLLALGTGHRFRLYFREAPAPGRFAGAEHRVLPFPRLWTHVRLSWEMARRPPDVLFVPAHVLPLVHPRCSVATVHDLGYLHFPQAHPPLQRLYLDLSTRWNAHAAAHLIADSQATKDDLVAHYHVPADKITVAYPGRDERLAPVRDPATIAAVKAHYGITDGYFLYLGTLQPRKNLLRLVEAFHHLAYLSTTQLVLAGQHGWLYTDLLGRVRELGLEDRVLLPGYIPDADKAALLSDAIAFLFPSLYEGFGLPVLEAQACGCPVVCSDTSSLPEVAGDAALLVDPTDTTALVEAMARLAANPALCADLTERGFANVNRFSWTACAETILSVLERCLSSPEFPSVPPSSPFHQPTHSSSSPPALCLLGVPVHDVTYDEAVALVEQFVATGPPHQIATVNPEFIIAARRNPQFRAVLEGADLCVPDGIGVLWAARWLGHPLRERVAGGNLVERIAARAVETGWRLYFLGAAPGVAERAAAALTHRYPGLTVAGCYAGSPSPDKEEEIVARVRAARTDVLLVAYGAPAQDLWIARNLGRTGAAVGIGIGGVFDFLAGVARRAPDWVQRLGLEWLHRLVRQPWRWRRQLALPQFAVLVLLHGRRGSL